MDIEQEILKIKGIVFDIIEKQDQYKIAIEQLEQAKREKLMERQKLLEQQKTAADSQKS